MDPQERAGDSHAVDVASLVQELMNSEQAATSSSETQLGGQILIAKVGDLARNHDKEEYVPHHVSIGPYHRNDPDLTRDEEKRSSLRAVLSAASPNVTVEAYLEELKRLRDQATRCYDNEFKGISNKDFVRMLLLDACYLLVLFSDINKYAGGRRKNNESIDSGNGHVQEECHSSGDKLKDVAVVRDVFYLAENQLPFFVIDLIYRLSNLEGSVSAAETITRYVRELLDGRNYSVATPNVVEPPGPPGNLLHLLHMHLKPTAVPASSTGSAATGDSMGRWRTATDYYFFAGVNFKKRLLSTDDGCLSILDVRLVDGGGTLEIPFLDIDGNMWRILRNLIALEQHNSKTTGSDVTAYCVFMSQLACTESDVELLSRRGVISHTCGNHSEVARFFTDLCKGVVEDDNTNYLKATWQSLEKRFQNPGRRWMAWLRHKYFRNPWVTVGLAATAVALACEVVQAVYSILGYKH